MHDPALVSTHDALLATLPRLASARRLAVDCESNGMHAWRGRLCVLQLAAAPPDAAADDIVLVDTVAVTDLSPLAALLGPDGPVKILHDAGFDARLLRDEGLALANVVDTAVHARFLGYRETGLASLLAARFGRSLEKSLQQHDWAKRPLGARELEYLAGDVADLGRLAASLEAEARDKDIADEVADETAYALRNAVDDEAPDRPAYARIKGARDLGPASRAVLREIAGVRERAAEAWDMPPGRVASNSALVQVARARPRTPADVGRVLPLQGRAITLAKDFADAVARGLIAGDVPDDERRWFAAERPPGDLGLRRVRETLLTHWRATEGAARGVDLQVVLPGHCLSDLAARGARTRADLLAISGFGEARARRYADALLEALNSVA